jgi:hypothetical protein
MGFGGHAAVQRQGDGGQHGLFVMVQDQSKDLDHLPVATGIAHQMPLQPLERLGHFVERCAVAQGAGLSLHHRQIMTPVIGGVPRSIMGSVDDALMLAYDLPFGDDQADGPIGERRRHAERLRFRWIRQVGETRFHI